MKARIVSRYVLGSSIASGGMATVYVGRLIKLPRVVAIKQLRPELAHDRSIVSMFLDEVQLLSRVRHKNVVAPIEHIEDGDDLYIVMEYIEGASLLEISRAAEAPIPERIASKLVSDVLAGLASAHEAVDPSGQPLGIVHRDISPHNILVGTDGAARLADFGIAKAAWRAHVTQHGQLKGKPGYMAPEQLTVRPVDRRADLYAAGIVLGELLLGRSRFEERVAATNVDLADSKVQCIREELRRLGSPFDAVVTRALARDPEDRFPDAKSMAGAVMDSVVPARDEEVGQWVARHARRDLERVDRQIEELDRFVAELGDGPAGEGQPKDGGAQRVSSKPVSGRVVASGDAFRHGTPSSLAVPRSEVARSSHWGRSIGAGMLAVFGVFSLSVLLSRARGVSQEDPKPQPSGSPGSAASASRLEPTTVMTARSPASAAATNEPAPRATVIRAPASRLPTPARKPSTRAPPEPSPSAAPPPPPAEVASTGSFGGAAPTFQQVPPIADAPGGYDPTRDVRE